MVFKTKEIVAEGEGEAVKLRLSVILVMLSLLVLPVFITLVQSRTSSETLYAHEETMTINGVNYYLHKLSPADGNSTTLSASAATAGRKLMGRWVYPLSGIVSVPASTWTVTYRAMKSASAKNVEAHGDVDILIRKADGVVRSTIATNVANSPSLTLTNTWETLIGTYGLPGYAVVDETDYLEVAYYLEVATPQSSKSVGLRVDDSALPLVDQTKIENVMFTYPNQAPVASFTFSPSNPLIYDTVTFDASTSYDPDGSIVSYTWDFGDGNITAVATPIITHVYTTATSTVNYAVTLTVADDEGSTGFTTQIVPVTNPTILYVSLPAGTYFGPHSDHWLSQCWQLNITALSGTFTLRINNTHASFVSYDTHLIIALNNASYEYLDSLTVDTTTIPKTAFTYGAPQPYGFTLTWEEDVYPTWFSDAYVVGDIDSKSYKDVSVSATFSNTTGVRIHFDAYGSQDSSPPPSNKGHVTHNAHEKDSTVRFFPPALVQYYLTVVSPYGIPDGEGWYNNCTDAYVTLNTGTMDHGNGTRRVFTHWSGDATGTNYASSDPIHMDQNKTAIANWKTQYYLTMSTNFGTVSPGDGWYDSGSIVSISATPPTTVSGERYVWNGWTGTGTGSYSGVDNPASITMDSPITETASWTHQYYLTVTSLYDTPGGEGWHDSGSTVYATLDTDTVDHGNGTRRIFTSWSEDASGTDYAQSDPILMDGPKTATANWKTQYYLTLTTSPGGSTDPSSSGWYNAGTIVSVTAIPDTNYLFDHWELNTVNVGSDNPYEVTMDTAHTLHAVFVYSPPPPSTYYLTIKIDPDGVTTIPGEGWYNESENVLLTAPEYVDVSIGVRCKFTHWDVDGASSTPGVNAITVHMDANHTATAQYIFQYYLTVTSPYGSPTPTSGWFDDGASITASVTSPWPGPTGTQYVCTGWTGTGSVPASGTTTSVGFTIEEPSSITWNWKTQYYLTVKTNPPGIAAISGEGWYDESTSVPLTAPSVIDYTFLYWKIDGVSQGAGVKSISVSMDAPHTATAYYEKKPVIVGGSTVSIKSPLLHTWVSLNALLMAAIFIASSWVRRRRRKTS